MLASRSQTPSHFSLIRSSVRRWLKIVRVRIGRQQWSVLFVARIHIHRRVHTRDVHTRDVQTGRLSARVGKRRRVRPYQTILQIPLLSALPHACVASVCAYECIQKWRMQGPPGLYRRGCTYAPSPEPVASSGYARIYSSVSRRSCYVSSNLQFKSGSDHALVRRRDQSSVRGLSHVHVHGYALVEAEFHSRNYARFCLGTASTLPPFCL